MEISVFVKAKVLFKKLPLTKIINSYYVNTIVMIRSIVEADMSVYDVL